MLERYIYYLFTYIPIHPRSHIPLVAIALYSAQALQADTLLFHCVHIQDCQSRVSLVLHTKATKQSYRFEVAPALFPLTRLFEDVLPPAPCRGEDHDYRHDGGCENYDLEPRLDDVVSIKTCSADV